MDGRQIAALIWNILYTFAWGACVGLFIYRFIAKPFWKEAGAGRDSKLPQASLRVLLCCCLSYCLAATFIYIGLWLFIPFGFDVGSPTETMYSIFAVFYTLSLFTMLYVWIQRIKTTFTGSAYEYSANYLKILKYLFWGVVVFALIVLVLFITNDGNADGATTMTTIIAVLAGIFAIAFFSLIAVILYSFISRLNKLRKIAELRLSKISESGDYDFESLAAIQRLIKVQLKLTISSVTAIVSTLCAIMMVIEFDQELQFMIYGTDCIVGFICMYCTMKVNEEFYEKLCKLCTITCNCCFNTTTLDQQIGHHIEVHSRSMQTTAASINTSGNSSNGSGGGNATVIKPTSMTTTEQNTPRPSGKGSHGVQESMPIDSITMKNEQSEYTENTQNRDVETTTTEIVTSDD